VGGHGREKVMEGIIRLTSSDGNLPIEGIFGESKETAGSLRDIDIIAQEESISVD
jgi:predicted RNA-binding protein